MRERDRTKRVEEVSGARASKRFHAMKMNIPESDCAGPFLLCEDSALISMCVRRCWKVSRTTYDEGTGNCNEKRLQHFINEHFV